MNARTVSVKPSIRFALLAIALVTAILAAAALPCWAARGGGGGNVGDIKPTPAGQPIIGATLSTGTPWAAVFDGMPRDLGGIYVGPEWADAVEIFNKVLQGGKANIVTLMGMVLDPALVQPNKMEDYKVKWVIHGVVVYAAKQPDSKDRAMVADALYSTLNDKMPKMLKAFVLQELLWCGSADMAPSLAKYLSDDVLYDYALRAMQAYGPGSLPTIREALGSAKGRPRLAIIQTLGVMRDAKSVEAIKPALADPQSDMRIAAMDALGNIGDASASEALLGAVAKAKDYEHTKACDDCLQLAKRLMESGDLAGAAKIYKTLAASPTIANDRHVQIAAAQGASLATGDVAGLVAAMKSNDPQLRETALEMMASMTGPAATKVLVDALAQAPTPADKITFLDILGSRRDAAVLPAVLAQLKSADDTVRLAAARAVASIGGQQATTALVAMLSSTNARDQQAAAEALKNLPAGKETDAAVALAIPKAASADARAGLVSVLGAHRAGEQAQTIVTALSDKEGAVRVAAIRAYGSIVGQADLPVLVKVLRDSKDDAEITAAAEGLQSACARQLGGEVSKLVAPAVATAAPANAKGMIKVLGAVGTPEASAAIASALKSSDAGVKETALDTLANWKTKDPAMALLGVAQSTDDQRLKIKALRGAVRLSNDKAMTADEKLKLLSGALKVAPRTEEKREILGALATVKSAGAIEIVVPLLEEEGVRDEACQAVIRIANLLGKPMAPATRDALTKVTKATRNGGIRNDAQRLLDQNKP